VAKADTSGNARPSLLKNDSEGSLVLARYAFTAASIIIYKIKKLDDKAGKKKDFKIKP
jgi:hypothetical protein